MLFFGLPTVILAFVNAAQSARIEPQNLLQTLQDQAFQALKDVANNDTTVPGVCTLSNASVRRDWADMGAKERKNYIKAVQCIIALPSKSDPAKVPGARTRYDDFVAQHINQTLTIHGTGNFLSWHRYFLFGYEKALREECGYKGYQPYWNWFSYQDDQRSSPIFDGSETSMGSDGSFVQHNGSAGGGGVVYLPSGKGGGCIASGPFKDLQVNLGPVSPTMDGAMKVKTPLAYNPRCAKRDLTTYASSNWLTLSNLQNITIGPASKTIETFQNELQGRFSDGFLGLHSAGHYTIGGDAADFYSSPNDPVFFMHHAMLDQVWWMWQALHLGQAKSVAGTIARNSNPPARNTTVEDLIQTNYLELQDVKIWDVLSTTEGPLCYIYR